MTKHDIVMDEFGMPKAALAGPSDVTWGTSPKKRGDDLPDMTIIQNCRAYVESIMLLLSHKNAKYGNSATEPLRIFSKAAPDEQLLARIDDKLSRIAAGNLDSETVDDLVGYLILWRANQ